MKKLIFFTACLAMALTASADYYLCGAYINGGEHWSTSYKKFDRVDDSNVYTAHVESLGSEIKINDGSWNNTWGSNGSEIKNGVGYVMSKDGGNTKTQGNRTYENVDLTLVDDNGQLTLTINGTECWYLVGDQEGNWNTASAKKFTYEGDGRYVAEITTLSKSFKLLPSNHNGWDCAQIGRQESKDNVPSFMVTEVASLTDAKRGDFADIYPYRYGKSYEDCHNLKDVKVILTISDSGNTIQILPKKWYYIGGGDWNQDHAKEFAYNEETGCYEYENASIGTNFKILNQPIWDTSEWTMASGQMLSDIPFQLTNKKKSDNINFRYVTTLNGKLILNPEDYTLTFSGEAVGHTYPEMAMIGSFKDTDDWGKKEENIIPLNLDVNSGKYTSAIYDFPESYDFKIKIGQNTTWNDDEVWGTTDSESLTYTSLDRELVQNMYIASNVHSTIGGKYAVQFNLNTNEFCFLEDYDFEISDIKFVKDGTRHYMNFSIDHAALASGVKHYLIEVYSPAPMDSRRRAVGSETIVGSTELSDLSAVSGTVELTNLPAQDKTELRVRAYAVKYYSSTGAETPDKVPAKNELGGRYLYDQTDGTTTGVESISDDFSAPAEYYNLQGSRVNAPANGVYIRVQGGKATKVVR